MSISSIPQASRHMLLNDANPLWATDQTSPFAKVASGYVAATRILTASANPPGATPFAAAKVAGQRWIHVGFSTGSVLPPGDYEVDSFPSDTTALLKQDTRLPLVNVADVRGYVYPTTGSAIAGGATVLAAQKECSFMFDCPASIVDGIEFTVTTAAPTTLTCYAGDGTTVMYTKGFAAGVTVGAVYPVCAPSGVGWLGGMAASLGVAAANGTARLLFRPVPRVAIAGLWPLNS